MRSLLIKGAPISAEFKALFNSLGSPSPVQGLEGTKHTLAHSSAFMQATYTLDGGGAPS